MKKSTSATAATAAIVLALSGCAASQKTFYAAPSRVKDTQLCRTVMENYQREGETQFVKDLAAEARARKLTLEQCVQRVQTEDAVIAAAVVGAAVAGAAIACQNGCGGGGYTAYQPSYAAYSDVDCRGGGGDGPRYTPTIGPFPINPMNDPHDLDRDGDGIACEAGEGG